MPGSIKKSNEENQEFRKESFQCQAYEDARHAPFLWNIGDLCTERIYLYYIDTFGLPEVKMRE